MDMDTDARREWLSAAVDGELRADELVQALNGLDSDLALQAAVHADWQAYHLVGDVLRSGDRAVCGSSSRFLERLQTRLQDEPPFVPALPTPVLVQRPVAVEAANDGVFRWKAVAGFASFAALAAIVWNVSGGGVAAVQPQLASAPAAVLQAAGPVPTASRAVEQPVTLVSGEPQIMIRDARLDELLAAHKQVGAGAALQMPAGFMRSATFAAPER